jgi:hypothetical protein
MTLILEVAAMTALAVPFRTSYGRSTIPKTLPLNTSARNAEQNLDEAKAIQELSGTGGRLYGSKTEKDLTTNKEVHLLKLESDEVTGGIRYKLATEAPQPPSSLIATETVASMLAKVKSVFALSISDLSKIIDVERPTIYAWMAERAAPHAFNLERLKELFNLAKQSEKWLAGLSDKQIKQLQIQDTSLLDLLSQTVIPRDLVIAGLENVRAFIERDVNSKQTAKLSLRDLAAKHGISMPSKETSKDTFDLITGKRTDPELE